MLAEEILQEAGEIISGPRNESYGDAKDSFEKISGLWSAYLGVNVSPVDVANMMILLKVSRQKTGKGMRDNFVDIAGYAALGGDIAGRSQVHFEERLKDNPDYPGNFETAKG